MYKNIRTHVYEFKLLIRGIISILNIDDYTSFFIPHFQIPCVILRKFYESFYKVKLFMVRSIFVSIVSIHYYLSLCIVILLIVCFLQY
jgi:hypothetical protein